MEYFFVILIFMLLTGFPIYLSLVTSAMVFFYINPALSFNIVIQKMLNAPNSFPLLAVPFFILAGQIMNQGDVTNRIFDFAQNLIGHIRGGLGYVNVLASMLFAGMSGSAIADAGGLGLVEIEAMKNHGYDDEFAIGVTAASSTIGPIIPPSIPFVVYGAMANVSIGGLFVGGIIPGVVMGLCMFGMVFYYTKKRNYPKGEKAEIKELLLSFKDAILALFTPIIIIGGIWGGFFTPTEAAFVSIIYSLIITRFVFKTLEFKDLPRLLKNTALMTIPAIVIVAGANIFGWVLNFERIDQFLLSFLFGITTNKILILLIINIILLCLGMIIEIVAAIMLLLPILEPIIMAIEIHPLHLGVIMVLNLMIGLLTPPVGFVLYILSSISEKPVDQIIRIVLPWFVPLITALMIVTYFPEVVMYLPRLLGFV